MAPQPVRKRKKKLHERDMVERLQKYEKLMAQHGIDFDSVLDSREVTHYEEYRTSYDLLHSSSDEGYERPTMDHAFDTIFSDATDGFPFFVGGSGFLTRITHLHPSVIQIFQLWQVYINNVDPLLKISHVPTLQTQIVGAGADLENTSRPLEALMFCIYLIAVKLMPEDEVQTAFGEAKAILLNRYNEAAQQALINAGFMRSNELMVLQAYLLYLVRVTFLTLSTLFLFRADA